MKHLPSLIPATAWLRRFFRIPLRDALLAVCIYALTCLLCALLYRTHGTDNYVSTLFIFSVFMTARFTSGYACGIFASFIGVLTVNFFFTYPFFYFNFTLTGYPLTISCMLAVSVTTSALTTRAKQSEQLRTEAEKEKLRGNLLRAVSHDLRTPLTSILGATSAVAENDAQLTSAQRVALLRGAQEDAQWLIRVVENLLAVTRIGPDGSASVIKTPQAAEEVVGEVLAKFKKHFSSPHVSVSVPDALLLIPMDAVLMEQVLFNLLENAAIHATGADLICLSVTTKATREGMLAVFTVSDNGAGLPPERLAHLFEGSLPGDAENGGKRSMGIGLSVCSTIIKAHGGTLRAENSPDGGAQFSFALACGENTPYQEDAHGT